MKNGITFLLYAQKTQDAPPLSPSNHPSKLMPNRLGAHIHVSKASAHLSTTILTSTDHKTLQMKQEKRQTFSDGTFFYTLTTAPPNTRLKK
jgi:hypothetical protein